METVNTQAQSISSLIDHNKVILNMTSDLHQLREFSETLHLERPLIDAIDEVIKRIETHHFSIAVVGEFKRGKSTFINALLGKEILPSDVLPTTATLNRVTYGIKPTAKLVFKDGHEEEIGVDQLIDYITKLTPESEKKAADIKQAEVYYPLEILNNNVDIFDTPGLNDDVMMTDVTLSIIPAIDAAILVIMPESPFSMYENDFLNKLLSNDLGRVIFIITAIDRIPSEKDRERIINAIEKRIEKAVERRAEQLFGKDTEECKLYRKRIGRPRVFGLSGLRALEAKHKHDDALLQESRFPVFMTALERFLVQERGVIVLQVLVDCVINSSKKILEKIGIQQGALQMEEEQFKITYEDAVIEMNTLRERQKQELERVDEATSTTQRKVRPLLDSIEGELKRAAEQVIHNTSISPSDLNKTNIDAFMQRMARKISNEVQNTGKTIAEKIQLEIQRELISEATRLQAFSISVEEMLHHIEMQFVDIRADSSGKRTASAENMVASVAFMTGLGGVWAGYRQAGGKGAVIGGLGTFGTAVGVFSLVLLLGFPITWPVALVTNLVSMFTGGWLAKKVFGSQIIKNFRENYTESVFSEIEKQVRAQRLDLKTERHIVDSFEALKRKIKQDVDNALDQTQKNLDELNRRRTRNEVITAKELAELEKISNDAKKIFDNACRLNNQLIEIMSV